MTLLTPVTPISFNIGVAVKGLTNFSHNYFQCSNLYPQKCLLYFTQAADMAVAKFTVNAARQEVIDFTVPYYSEPVAMYMQKLPSFSWFTLFAPFQQHIWACVVASVCVVTVALYLSERLYQKSDVSQRFIVETSFIYAVGTLCLRGKCKK